MVTLVGKERIQHIKTICFSGILAAVSAEIDKMPCIVETLKGCEPLFPRYSTLTYRINSWEGKKSTDKEDRVDIICIRKRGNLSISTT